MAIQLPNPGLGDGQTGDNEFVMWTKVKDNFNNQTHAASRLIGIADNNVVQKQDAFKVVFDTTTIATKSSATDDANTFEQGSIYRCFGIQNIPAQYVTITTRRAQTTVSGSSMQEAYHTSSNNQYFRSSNSNNDWSAWAKVYTDKNTTKDTATGFLKVSSPVLHVYNDKITKIHEAEQLDIKVDKKGTGHYEIHGTTGLRKNDGWFISPPRDVHGNVLCMVDLEEKDGVVILKTYKKKFDFETVSIVHDYDNSTDIPDGVCVEFRFNDLPEEQLDEPIE